MEKLTTLQEGAVENIVNLKEGTPSAVEYPKAEEAKF
jgi:hypothetical protein